MKKVGVQGSEGPIVVVDDDEVDLIAAHRAHAKSIVGNPLVAFRSGAELLLHLEEVESGRAPMPSIVLLDINMPLMDGFEVIQAVRSQPAFERIPIITMLTNSDNPRDVERARAAGANGFQVKPLRSVEMVAFFDSLADLPAGDGSCAAPAPARHPAHRD